jgi:glycosyltransferase involved in cell wall biosynthesis
MAPFRKLRAQGARVGALLHAFPSFIHRATVRATLERELPLAPLPAELDLVARLDLVVTPGAYVARLLAASDTPVPCVVCPPGVDHAEPSGTVTPSTPDARLLVIANLTPAKGVADALRALAPLHEQAWELTLVGALDADPSHVAALRALAVEAGLSGRVHFRGALSHAEALAELRRSHALLLPSYTENCPLVALEALSAGVPIVGYAVGGLPDLVQSSVSGLLVPELDVPALGAALRHVLEHPDERARLARGAATAGSALPTWAEAATRFQRALLPYEK